MKTFIWNILTVNFLPIVKWLTFSIAETLLVAIEVKLFFRGIFVTYMIFLKPLLQFNFYAQFWSDLALNKKSKKYVKQA